MFCQELAAQIGRDLKPSLDEAGVGLVCVGIGTSARAKEFCEHVGFPEGSLYSDPDNQCYTALGLKSGFATTFLQPSTPLSIAARLKDDGATDLRDATARWKPWIPPRLEQGLQQGGMLVFQGGSLLWSHYDPSTGAHADLNQVKEAALSPKEAP